MVRLQRFELKHRLLGFQDMPDSAPMVPRPSEPKLWGSGPRTRAPGPGPGPNIFIHRLGIILNRVQAGSGRGARPHRGSWRQIFDFTVFGAAGSTYQARRHAAEALYV